MDKKYQPEIKKDDIRVCAFYDEEEKIFNIPFRKDYKLFNDFVEIPLKLQINRSK